MRVSIYILFSLFALTSCQKFSWNNPYDSATQKSVFTPDDLSVRQEGENLLLSWNQDNSNISGFKLFRSIDRGVSTELVSLNKSTLSYTDANIQGGKTYTYTLKAYADKNESNEVSTEIIAKSRPTINTITASAITENTATSGGTIVSDGGSPITSKGLVWSTSVNPTMDLTTKTNDGNGNAAFERILTNLSPNTIYYVRAYAINSVGTAYGNQITFTTSKPPAPPILESLSQGLVAYYPFNGNANDESGNFRNSELFNANFILDRKNVLNSAIEFKGNGWVTLPAIAITGTSARTISCWVKFNTISSNETSNNIFSFGSAQQSSAFNLRLQNGKLNLMGFNNDYFNLARQSLLTSVWYNIIITYENSNLKFYVDGINIESFQTIPPLNTNGNSNLIGKSNHLGWEYYLNGAIDEFRIYNRLLTQEEITYLANN